MLSAIYPLSEKASFGGGSLARDLVSGSVFQKRLKKKQQTTRDVL